MSEKSRKIDNILKKIETSYSKVLKVCLESSEKYALENIELRREIIRLEEINRQLISVVAEDLCKKTKEGDKKWHKF